jgi:DNA-binding CsgD family transcriptional regulator
MHNNGWRLTPRELVILRLLVNAPQSNKRLARALGLTEGTIKVHMHNIFAKAGVHDRTALVALLLRSQHETQLLTLELHRDRQRPAESTKPIASPLVQFAA